MEELKTIGFLEKQAHEGHWNGRNKKMLYPCQTVKNTGEDNSRRRADNGRRNKFAGPDYSDFHQRNRDGFKASISGSDNWIPGPDCRNPGRFENISLVTFLFLYET